jgi:hypothetical protein
MPSQARSPLTPGDNGNPITSYTVTATPAAGGTPLTASVDIANTLTIPGLSNGSVYNFTVSYKDDLLGGVQVSVSEVVALSHLVTDPRRPGMVDLAP